MPRVGRVFKKSNRADNFRKKKPVTPITETENASVSASAHDQSGTEGAISTPQNADIPPQISSSKKKLADFESEYNKISIIDGCYDIVNVELLDSLLRQIAKCSQCGGALSFSAGSRRGFSVKFMITCEECNFSVQERNTKNVADSYAADINVRFAYAMRSIGKGQESAKLFCGLMNLPNPPEFNNYNQMLRDVAEKVCKESMNEAVEETVQQNRGIRELKVSVDGSWQKRGHTSLNGIVSVISFDIGKVVDIEIMTKHCRCKKKLQGEHEANCIANYSGSSGGMEVQGAVSIFKRSEQLYDVKYKYYLGDGDSAAFTNVEDAKPYGPDFNIEKIECAGHIQKRMGSRLRDLKKKTGKRKLSDGKFLGGRKRLTLANINQIHRYYGLCIKRNKHNLEGMRQAVWAEFFHLSSTNENPSHNLCPTDSKTWCKYQKAIQQKQNYDHTKHTHLHLTVMDEIKPIFRHLADPNLLRKCLDVGSQNANESLNGLIWSKVPKSTFVEKNIFDFGVYEAVACYKKGNVAMCQILSKMGINPGGNRISRMKQQDKLRIKKAEQSISEIHKKCRQKNSLARKKLEDKYEASEDPEKPLYKAGAH